jgi:dienelactone hydrolase
MIFTRVDTSFISQGTRCAAWLYLPAGVAKPPVVILAHGFGGERTFRLPAYAEHFASQGMACLVFDYRTFGSSEGEPRNYVSPKRHLEDWQAAIAFARTSESVDANRVALWGTSLSGGHVIVTAARDPSISAIVAQIPFVDGRSSERSLGYKLQAVYHGLRDAVGAALFERRHYVPIVGEPGSFAMLNTPDALEGAKKLLPEGTETGRKCPAVIALTAYFYRPIRLASQVACPALVVYAERDTLVPAARVQQLAAAMPKATLVALPVRHFDFYVGETFDQVVRLEADFLREQLCRRPA